MLTTCAVLKFSGTAIFDGVLLCHEIQNGCAHKKTKSRENRWRGGEVKDAAGYAPFGVNVL